MVGFGVFAEHCTLFSWLSALLFFWFGFVGVPLAIWTIAIGLVMYGFGAQQPWWTIYAAVGLILNLRFIRSYLLSLPVMKTMKALQLVPAISPTERTAIEAGVVWVEGELFSGKPNFKKMMAEPYPDLNAEEKAFMAGPVEKLCNMVDDWKTWQTRELDQEVWDFIKKEKFLGMIIPKEYDGLGFSALCHSEVIKKVSSRSVPAGISIMVPNSLGPAELLIHYGTDAQKKYFLPRLAKGQEMPCFALTEPGAGSDAASIQASGELFKGDDGKLYMRLNWEKRWITLAAISTILGLAFRLKDPKNLLGKGEDLGITCALIPSNTPGVELGKRHDPMGVPFYNCPTRGKNVVVPVDAIIGGMDGVGIGWKMLMESLGAGRGISLPAQSTGGTQLAALIASAHATVRKQFGLSIGKFEGIEEPLARLGANSYILEASRRYTLGAIDKGIKPPVVTAIAKYNSTEIMRSSLTDALDILGGAGISRGPRNVLSNVYIGAPIGITVEGANILTRTLMIFGQGALRAHPYAFKEVAAIEENNLAAFDKAFWAHIGHVIRNLVRAVGLSLTRGRLACSPKCMSPVSKYYKKLAWVSATFALLTDVAMGALGGKLKQRGKLTGRFADILSWMYLSTAVLRRWEAEGCKKEDLPFVHYSMAHAFNKMQRAFDGIFCNFDGPVGFLMRWLIHPWSYLNTLSQEPSDALSHAVSVLLQTPSEQRDHILKDGIFVPTDADHEQIARLEKTMRVVKATEETERKVKRAIRKKEMPKIKGTAAYEEAKKRGIITEAEFKELSHVEALRWDAIQVDEFTLEDYARRAW